MFNGKSCCGNGSFTIILFTLLLTKNIYAKVNYSEIPRFIIASAVLSEVFAQK